MKYSWQKHGFTKAALILLLGVAAGFLNGLMGAGGGIVIVAGLSLLCGKYLTDRRTLFATALVVMLPLSVFSAWRYFRHTSVPEGRHLWLLLPAAVGGLLGAWLLRRLTPRVLSKIFAGVVLVSGIVMVTR